MELERAIASLVASRDALELMTKVVMISTCIMFLAMLVLIYKIWMQRRS